jgi:hypothetical protein
MKTMSVSGKKRKASKQEINARYVIRRSIKK